MTKNELIDEILKRTTFESDNERTKCTHRLYTQPKKELEEILHKFALERKTEFPFGRR